MKIQPGQKKKGGGSVQDLIGIKGFTKYGLQTEKDELLFYLVAPTNISVLSYANIDVKIRHLMLVLTALPDIEITCTDSSECFDDNQSYLKKRAILEENAGVREILLRDAEFLDHMQVEMATARQFLFTVRVKSRKEKQVFETANAVEKALAEQGFEAKRMTKGDIKRFLALYFDASMQGEQLPDTDGAQFFDLSRLQKGTSV